MKRLIEIDPDAGFCPGVVSAIEKAEEILAKDGRILCLGELVHNEEELKRLERKGLVTITHDEIKDATFEKLLIRAHGEPPETYKLVEDHHVDLEDATCPVVLKLQERIRKAFQEMKKKNGCVVIFGKKNHPEVIGLNGQTENNAIVVLEDEDLQRIDFAKPLQLFSQTTMDKGHYDEIAGKIEQNLLKANNKEYKIHKSVCGKVANRVEGLKAFAGKHDVMVFVSGRKSSNGKFLYSVCKRANENSIWVSSESDLNPDDFRSVEKVGVSGATSTPTWLMKKIAEKIRSY